MTAPDIVSTHALPPAQQFDAWCGWFNGVFEVTPEQPSEAGFLAESKLWVLDGMALSRVSAPSLHVRRTKAQTRREPVDHWVITLGRVTTGIKTSDTALQAPAGTPFVLSLGNELVSERSEDERLQLYLGRDNFHEIAPLLDKARGTVLDTGLGRLLADYMLLLERRLPEIAPDELPRLTRAVCAMVGACLAPSAERVATAAGQIDISRFERARRVIKRHLRSPSLGPGLLCREVGMSRSQLYRLFDNDGGVARYIQRQRLLTSHAALSDVANTQSITTLAEELCFADASGFSRAFRREFGISPRDVRAQSLVGLPTPPPSRRGPDLLEARTLSDCLRAL
jgi:AraC-like DNA-binding protein